MMRYLSDRKKRRRIWNILVLSAVAFYISAYLIISWSHAIRFKGQWTVFDSQNYSTAETFPDGIRFEYPKSWDVTTYEKGGTPNLGVDLRIYLKAPLQRIWMDVYWRREEDWTLDDVLDWYIDDVERTVPFDELMQSRDQFTPALVGVGDYPALVHDYPRSNLGILGPAPGPHHLMRAVLFKVGDEAFAITLTTADKTDGSLEIFQRILDTLEIYK